MDVALSAYSPNGLVPPEEVNTLTETPLTYSVAQAAAKLDVSADMVYQRVAAREWPCTRMGRKIRFTPAQMTEILRLCEQPAVTRTPRRRSA